MSIPSKVIIPEIRDWPVNVDTFLRFLKPSTIQLIVTGHLESIGPFTINDFEPIFLDAFEEQFKQELTAKIEIIRLRHFDKYQRNNAVTRQGAKKINDFQASLLQDTMQKFDLFFQNFKKGRANTSDIPVPLPPNVSLQKKDLENFKIAPLALRRQYLEQHLQNYATLINGMNAASQGFIDKRHKTQIAVDLARKVWQTVWSVGNTSEQLAFIDFCRTKGISLAYNIDLKSKSLKELITELIAKNKEVKKAKEDFIRLFKPPPEPKEEAPIEPVEVPNVPDLQAPELPPQPQPLPEPDPEILKRTELTLSLNRARHKLDGRVTRFDIPFEKIRLLEGFQDPDRHGRPCLKYQYPYKEKTPELEERHLNFLIEQWQNHNAPVESLFRLPKEVIEEYSYPQIHESPNNGDQPGRWCDCTKVTGMGTPNEKRVKGVLTVATDKKGVMYHRVFVPTEKVDFNLISPSADVDGGEEEKGDGPEQPFEYQNGRHREALPNGDLAFIFGQDGDPYQALFLVHKKKTLPN